MKISLLSFLLFLACLNSSIADLQPNEHYEGTVTRDGICYEYIILHYSSIGEGGKEIRNVKIFEGRCGENCMDEVYNGPLNVYSGPYWSQALLGGLPMSIDGSGNGVLTVPFGQGGFFGPPQNSSCKAKFSSDNSTTLIISYVFLSGFIWQ